MKSLTTRITAMQWVFRDNERRCILIRLNTIYNEDCLDTMKKMKSGLVDVVLTSPPYNTARNNMRQDNRDRHEGRYDIHIENKTDEEYIDWTINNFKQFDRVLSKNGCILYNLSYSSENAHLIWLTVAEIIKQTSFTTADTIVWKKSSALPNNMSPNKLTRIVEYIFVFCRKTEFKTFSANKQVVSLRKTGQRNYENVSNFLTARNNDGPMKLNKATYSTELCEKLLGMYATPNSLIFDPFMGTGTTGLAAKRLGHSYIGSEISKAQCEFAENRIKNNN